MELVTLVYTTPDCGIGGNSYSQQLFLTLILIYYHILIEAC